jgi:hypothetical protein
MKLNPCRGRPPFAAPREHDHHLGHPADDERGRQQRHSEIRRIASGVTRYDFRKWDGWR